MRGKKEEREDEIKCVFGTKFWGGGRRNVLFKENGLWSFTWSLVLWCYLEANCSWSTLLIGQTLLRPHLRLSPTKLFCHEKLSWSSFTTFLVSSQIPSLHSYQKREEERENIVSPKPYLSSPSFSPRKGVSEKRETRGGRRPEKDQFASAKKAFFLFWRLSFRAGMFLSLFFFVLRPLPVLNIYFWEKNVRSTLVWHHM